ncbi:HIT family protein [Flavobacteriales bacterium]|nr:HIT family protein [Flavobacteriales bacterium]
MSSVFSKIVNGAIPSYKVSEDENFLAFLDVNPLVKGHVLVIPKQEVDYIFDLEDDLLSGLNLFAKKVAIKMKRVLPCERIGVTVIGLEVPHAHIHLIPINSIADMDFSKPKKKFDSLELENIAKSILEA